MNDFYYQDILYFSENTIRKIFLFSGNHVKKISFLLCLSLTYLYLCSRQSSHEDMNLFSEPNCDIQVFSTKSNDSGTRFLRKKMVWAELSEVLRLSQTWFRNR